jgi:dTDP-4-amino-4,6-dideoxygalactose transaminase
MIPHSRPFISEREIQAVSACLREGMINEGRATASLEMVFKDRYGARAAVATGSGSQALWLALKTLGVAVGDEVIVPTYVCAEVLGVIEASGAIARIVDVAEDYLIDTTRVAAAIGSRTRAIVVPYVFGTIRDMTALQEMGIPIIEDFAQCITPPEEVHPVGELAIFSFEGTKVVTGGEGGMVLAFRDELSARLRRAKSFRDTSYKLNLYPLSDLQATLIKVQMERLPEMHARRQVLAQRYLEALATLPGVEWPQLVGPSPPYRLLLRMAAGRAAAPLEALIERFEKQGVAVRRPVDRLLHRLAGVAGEFPVAEQLFARTLSIPFYPALSDADQDRVIEACRRVLPHPCSGRVD